MVEKSKISRKALSLLLAVLMLISALPLTGLTAFAEETDDLLDTPALVSVSNAATGVEIKWSAVDGAEGYRVFYKVGEDIWRKAGDTAETSFTWTKAKSDTDYAFTVRCTSADGKSYTSLYDESGLTIHYIAAPKLSQVAITANGIQIKWGKVAGAQNYRVFYKTGNDSWKKAGDSSETSFIWKKAKQGTKYAFTVRCLSEDGKTYISSYDPNGITVKGVSEPKLTAASNAATGVKISWNKVSGAEKYRVFYKNSSGTWIKIADTASTSYTWKEVKSGKNYTFTVRCINSDGKAYASTYNSKGISIKYIAAPQLTSVAADNGKITIKWDKVSGATKYRVFAKNSSGGWSKLGDTTSTSYTLTGAKVGKKYTYTVRCISTDGKSYVSSYDSKGKGITYLSTPALKSVSVDNSGITIKWGKVSGAEKYRVFYKTGNSGWTKIGDTSSTSFTWSGAKTGKNYTFTVRCLAGDGKSYPSGYNATGKSMKYTANPRITSISAGSKGIAFKWSKVSGAEKYQVLRKTGNGSWTSIGVTAYTNFTDIQAKKGTTYSYTIRCITAGGTYTSGYDTKGKSATSVSNPPTKNDMVAVAEKELGYTGGKKIWTWAGFKSRVPWCNLFVTWCADQLGYYESGRIPLIQWPKDSVKWFKEKGLFKNSSYIPKSGDLIYFVHYGESQPYHIGIVEKYQNGIVYTIEGNSGDVVKRRSFEHNSNIIYGYATPDYGHN